MLEVTPYDETHFETLVDFYGEYPQRHRSMSLPPLARPQIEQWVEKLTDRGRNILAFDGERLIGHVAYSPRDGAEPELVVFIDAEYHGRGVGTELCRQAIASAIADGHDSMKLHVHSANGGAIHVYESLGFDTVDRDDDTLLMRLEIDESVRDDVCEGSSGHRYVQGVERSWISPASGVRIVSAIDSAFASAHISFTFAVPGSMSSPSMTPASSRSRPVS